ncbi:hypothetical protein [Luteimonas aquatica]|uniref:hypothetical protein n=1 Tax=Luteimonas aquatica TaxID=450364 RepID=UPI001F5A5F16|nr:hypothetical protein [Luteimonas aquatica]
MAGTPGFNDNVFINCPFDAGYWPLFEVVVFTVYACGFVPRCALEESDSGDVRIDKIVRLIRESRLGIHDISRVELDGGHQLPRFNMPFELGLDLGFKKFHAEGGRKRLLILDTEPYRYQKFLSDIAGQDIRAHGNAPEKVLREVREWLRVASRRETLKPTTWIRDQYRAFATALPEICDKSGLERDSLNYLDYAQLVEEWLQQAVS